jgi:hypothetical protein
MAALVERQAAEAQLVAGQMELVSDRIMARCLIAPGKWLGLGPIKEENFAEPERTGVGSFHMLNKLRERDTDTDTD